LAQHAVVVLIVGGSQGSRAINEAMLKAIGASASGRIPGVEALWATGPSHLETVRSRLALSDSADWIHPVGYIDDMPSALAASDIAVSRAGAMMTAELLAWGIPAILIPLPTAAADHQTVNARALAAAGVAIHLEERSLTSELIHETLSRLVSDPARRARMAEAARLRAQPNAAREIARELLTLMKSSR
jgi:UDP-N-acetylglucosamine--N-acetylmuramyl-(pentapeptide) pyrophosphoryl-undecaprenol N-acetylglucosamine transferase